MVVAAKSSPKALNAKANLNKNTLQCPQSQAQIYKGKVMEIIKESFFEVIKNSIGVEPEESIIPLKKGYMTSIEMIGTGKNVLLVFNKPFLKIMCLNFLSESAPTPEALEDMARELANLTVGHAKVIAQRRDTNFNISTPSFLGVHNVTDYDQGIHFRLKGTGHCSIFLRAKQ